MKLDNVCVEMLERTKRFSMEEHKALMGAFRITEREPAVKIATAMFRDALMFHEMANATIMQMRMEINSLKRQVEGLNERVLKDE